MLNKTFKFKNRGFTLIEVVIAVSILTIGVLAAFNVVQNITIYSKLTSSRLTATYLAQEGIELVRNQRDTNWLEGMDWGTNKGNLIVAAWPPSGIPRFTRNIDIDDHVDYIEVSVGVSWQERGTTHSATNTTELYDWLP